MKKVTIQYTIPNPIEELCRSVIVSVLMVAHVGAIVIKVEHIRKGKEL